MKCNRVGRRQALSMLLLSLVVSNALATVTARVDRPAVDLNESFLLEVKIDTLGDLEPDLSVLEEDFVLGTVSSLNNTSIFNGQIRRSRTWSISLMAKSVGQQRIPAIAIGNEKTTPITITVKKPAEVLPGEADVFVTSEVDVSGTFVQAQILNRIKVYRAVNTRQPSLQVPTISGVEALDELVGADRIYESILNGKAYSVVERTIAIYPQENGEITLSPARFEARVLRDGRITGRKVFISETHTISVAPIPPPPADYPDAQWLPAQDVRLSEEWSRDLSDIKAGEPITRHVTISALGQIETQLPALELPEIGGINVYSDKPDLSRAVEEQGIRGIRKDQYAMIALRAGVVEIPEVTVPWWDLEAGAWRVARLPGRTINVEAAEMIAEVVQSPDPSVDTGAGTSVAATSAANGTWKKASQLLVVVWVLTLLAWWWSTRRMPRSRREPAPPPIYKQQAKFIKAARKAALAGDKRALRKALIEWGRLQWPDDVPRSIGDLANRVAAPLADELHRLSAVSYGQTDAVWDADALAKSLRSIVIREAVAESDVSHPLPPLMPQQ